VVIQVILSHATHLYFDLKQEPDPEELGLYWAARETPLKKVFSYRPESIYDNVDVDLNGLPVDADSVCADDLACPRLTAPRNIIGMGLIRNSMEELEEWGMENVDPMLNSW